jgi:DNA-directed RNA polymerase specialized sigma24 family protein
MTATPARPPRRPGPGFTVHDSHGRAVPAAAARQAMTGGDVAAALGALTARDRQILVEIYYRKRSVAQTAESLAIPVATVTSRADLAIRQLLPALRAVAAPQASDGPRPQRSRPVRPA